jgi:hypothetical protein
MTRILAVVLGIVLVSAGAFAQDSEFTPKEWEGDKKLNLTKGTMQLGGFVGFDFDMWMPDHPDADSQSGYTLVLSPRVGYFVVDNFVLEGSFSVEIQGGDLYENPDIPISFSAGGRYFFNAGTVFPYFGVNIGMLVIIPDDDEANTDKALTIRAPIGLLWPLNDWVALDLGFHINFNISFEDPDIPDSGFKFFNFFVGYVGVEAFF